MKKIKLEEFILDCKNKHNNKYDYSLVNYKNSKEKIKIICPIHGIFEQLAYDHKNGRGCPKCAIEKNTKRNSLNDIIDKAILLHKNKYSYENIFEYKNMHDRIKINCKEHGVFECSWHYHINKKRGCPKCAIEKRRDTKEKFIIKSNLIHNNKYDYSLVDYKNSKTKVKIICPVHGIFKQCPQDHINSAQGCPKCVESKGERKIRNFLDNKNIKYEYQKTFKDCKYIKILFFDFYLKDYNICIEYDGVQHYNIIEYWGGLIGLFQRQIRDNIKTEYCKNNNIKLVRIMYSDNILERLEKLKLIK
ncbi:DUF723 domain-containing protein [Candidatus Dojkabacteria bacterium]|jgi:hypothetical protein|nr:DUF723 domain-containing protein [Candidatus Dojkabacteria bacterium]